MLGLALIDWIVIGVYIAGITTLGLTTTKRVKSTGDYFMGGRRFGRLFMIAQAFGTGTRTDQAVAVIGASAQVGLAGIWYQWLYLFSTPFFWIIAPIYRRLRYLTVGDFFEQRYGNGMGAVYAFSGILFFALNIGIVLKGTGVTIEAVSGGAISTNTAVVAMMVFFIVYGLLGGLVAVGVTHTVQGLFILILSFLLIPFALSQGGGLEGIRSALPEGTEWFSLVANEEVTGFFIVMAVLNALVGVSVHPHHMAINGAGKDEIACRTGWTYGTFIKRLATLGWAFTGILAVALFPDLFSVGDAERELAFGMAVVRLLPVGFVGLMVAAMVAAVVAGCNSYMVNGSALFVRNFYQRYLNRDATESHYLTMARSSAVLIVFIGVFFALYIPSVVAGLMWIWRITAFLGIAFWMAIVWRRANRYGAWASLILAAGLGILTKEVWGWSFPAQVALYLPAGFLGLIVFSLLTPRESEDRLNTFHSLINTPVGFEQRLRDAGIEIIHEGDGAPPEPAVTVTEIPIARRDQIPLLDDVPAQNRGESLLMTNLLSIRENFSISRYRVDLKGFGVAWGIVAGYLVLALVLSVVASGG